MRKWRFDLFMPFLVATYPIVYLYSVNFFRVDLIDVVTMIVVSLLVFGLLLLILRLILRSTQRSLFVTGWFALLFFSFGHAYQVLRWVNIRYFPFDKQANLLALYGALAVGAVIFAILVPRPLAAINRYIGMFTALLLVISLGTIGFNALTAGQGTAVEVEGQIGLEAPETLPDFYYIILDEYAGNGMLRDYMGYDNSDFTESLRDRGFYVAENAHANYFNTSFALASTLNMTYLDDLYGHRGEDLTPLVNMVQNNLVAQTLKAAGYTHVYIATAFPITRTSPLADIFYTAQSIKIGDFIEIEPTLVRLNDFHLTLGQSTLLLPSMRSVERGDKRAGTMRGLDILAEIPQMPEPTYTFAHFTIPHAPFVFGRNDGPVDPNGYSVDGGIVDDALYEAFPGYIDQIVFTNRVVSQIVDTILANSETEPIIVIQGDHGFRWMCTDCYAESSTWDDDHYANVVLPILSSYYLPGDGEAALYPTISPVNSFRVILNTYFGADLELLDDRHYRPEDYYSKPYYFVDVTDTVRDAEAAASQN